MQPQPPNTPPRRRNAQVRTYIGLLNAGLRDAAVDDRAAASEILRELRTIRRRLQISTKDPLTDFNVQALKSAAHELLGFSQQSLLQPKGGEE